jgi:hypothetical protein
MRIVTFRHNGIVQHGARTGDTVTVYPDAPSAVELAMGSAGFAPGAQVAIADVELLCPVPLPGKVICSTIAPTLSKAAIRFRTILRY